MVENLPLGCPIQGSARRKRTSIARLVETPLPLGFPHTRLNSSCGTHGKRLQPSSAILAFLASNSSPGGLCLCLNLSTTAVSAQNTTR